MKRTSHNSFLLILSLVFLLGGQAFWFNLKEQKQKARIEVLEKENLALRKNLKSLRRIYREHLKKCSLISTDRIKSWRGRYIVLKGRFDP